MARTHHVPDENANITGQNEPVLESPNYDPRPVDNRPAYFAAKSTPTVPLRPIMLGLGMLLLCLISFYGGTLYQKAHSRDGNKVLSFNTTRGGFSTGGGGFGVRRIGELGKVTAISSSSISVQNLRNGDTATYAITSSTAITNGGTTVAASSIKVGDTVLVRVSSSDANTVTAIVVNPAAGGQDGMTAL